MKDNLNRAIFAFAAVVLCIIVWKYLHGVECDPMLKATVGDNPLMGGYYCK